MNKDVKVAISSDFFSAFAKLPQNQQGKVSKFITNFQQNPESSGINYEKVHDFIDPNMRSVRIDQTYRGIVLKPDTGNVFMLLWVDHHDNAYDWARRHRCNINPGSGAIQIYEAEDAGLIAPSEAVGVKGVPGAFEELKDKELLRLGVPQEMIALVRGVHNELDLDAVEHRLPVEAYEGLFMYIAGTRYDQIINDRELVQETDIDVADFSAALDRLATQSRFVVVEDDIELQAMLNAPMDKWRVFLHPSQRKLVEGTKNGASRVLGGAGTGKTVVAMHRAKWLAENALGENQKILFTTFTKNLATDIYKNLASICTQEVLDKIEVINLDRWVTQYLRQHNYEYSILYSNEDQKFWEKALDLALSELDLPEVFYQEEWRKVIQPQSITTIDEYKRASRVGRGTRLNRVERLKVWPVFEEYRNLLTQSKKKEVDDAYRDVATLLENDTQAFPYQAVIVDEGQDMSTQAFKLMRQLVPEGHNDIFVVGDGHQRIYGRNKVVLSQCGINIRGRARKLKVNYRTTEEIRHWAVNLLEGFQIDDLDGGLDDNKGYKSLTHGNAPQIEQFESSEKQSDFISTYLKQQASEGLPLSHICIVTRTNKERDGIDNALKRAGIEVAIVDAYQESLNKNAVRLATMHRVKGLEFDEMILASVNEGIVPLNHALENKGDEVEKRLADIEERGLMYVAITRAKKRVLILSYGKASSYLVNT